MQILIINSGSSSIKFQVIKMPSEEIICKGLVERIGLLDGLLHYEAKGQSHSQVMNLKDHNQGLLAITDMLLHDDLGVLKHADDINIVAHRVVHGGSKFDQPTKINDFVLAEIERLSSLAPLHNPANATGIKVAIEIFKKAGQVAIFDTAYHQTIPEKAYRYAIPKQLSDENNIRVYGFHGTSHKYVSEQAANYVNKTADKIISIHLGNGCSITAIKEGKSIDHSLGFSPTNGLIMGTRSGDIDHSIVFYLMDSLGMSSSDVNKLLQKQSGLLGLTGYSDLREIQNGAKEGNEDCKLALVMTAYRIKKFIGSYIATLNGVDVILFTGGIGENSSLLRAMVCEKMEALGIYIDSNKNAKRSSGILEIQKDAAAVKILVVPTNEELEIAKQTYAL
ncbi:acetate kinase [Cellulophaga sp. HaHaR_3_176]|uniref:acetate/propionate family kinase n=1 Tax=Cellulophaga sp. HaHaR_3_176 TaxID=1942464 RepID=UPI001C1F682D|nr:acetate kinase [Cellulophaga sp. HaHaR_3_176]QWX83898.1 acetate kinase [Cellulophaga sp. HaHaR_3_176]